MSANGGNNVRVGACVLRNQTKTALGKLLADGDITYKQYDEYLNFSEIRKTEGIEILSFTYLGKELVNLRKSAIIGGWFWTERLEQEMTVIMDIYQVPSDYRHLYRTRSIYETRYEFEGSMHFLIFRAPFDWFKFSQFKLGDNLMDECKYQMLDFHPIVLKQSTWTAMFFPQHLHPSIRGVTFCVMVSKKTKLSETEYEKVKGMFKSGVILPRNADYIFSKKRPKFMAEDGTLDPRIPIHEKSGTNADDLRKLGFIQRGLHHEVSI